MNFPMLMFVVGFLAAVGWVDSLEAAPRFGVDANYALGMEEKGERWSDQTGAVDPFASFAEGGCDAARIRLWVDNDGSSHLNYALKTAQRAQKAGLKPVLVLFLSDDWADFVKQPAPRIWRDLALEQRAAAIEAYAERVTRHFVENGVAVETFEIGNEIDNGICGEFESEPAHRASLEYLQEKLWPRMVPLILAAESGVRKAVPKAQFILHLAQWNNIEYCAAFWKGMLKAGVQLDFPGLSYFPSSSANEAERTFEYLQSRINIASLVVRKPVWICESGYPAEATFGGQFAEWNHAAPGYPLNAAGQARWVLDYRAFVQRGAHLAGAFYWSPEWYGKGTWDAFALFDAQGLARPALEALRGVPPGARHVTLRSVPAPAGAAKWHVYFGNLHSHTANSDGAGTPAEAYAFAREVAKLDFLAITDHNHLLGGEHATPEERAALYAGPGPVAILPAAAQANENGRFVALYGQEYSSMSQGNHVNVFDVPAVVDVPNGKFDQLLAWLKAHPDTGGQVPVVQFNHPGLSFPVNTISRNEYGRDDFGDEAAWLREMGAATSLIEIINGEPAAGDPRRRSPQVMEEDFRMFLQRGFHLAPTGDQDNHHQEWGTCTETRTGIIAAELTKPALLGAMRARHVYASEDRNLQVIVTVNGHLAGEVLKTPGPLQVAIHLEDPDEPGARYVIDVVKGAIDGLPAEVVATARRTGGCGAQKYLAFDGLELAKPGEFLYFRITQSSEQGMDRVWTAPVWVE